MKPSLEELRSIIHKNTNQKRGDKGFFGPKGH